MPGGERPSPILLGVAAAASATPWVAGAIAPSNWLWGVDSFAYLPAALGLTLAALALAGLAPAVARPVGEALDRLGAGWVRGAGRADALAGLALGIALLFLHDRVRFVGDASLRFGSVHSGIPFSRLFPQAFPLDVLINGQLPRGLMGFGLTAEHAMQIVGALLGGAFGAIGAGFLRLAGARGAALPGGAMVLLGGGCLLGFPGYDKFGPLLVGIALAALGTLRLSRSSRGAWTLAAGVAISVLSHRSGFLVVPAAIVAFVQAIRSARDRPERRRLALAAAVAGCVAAAMSARSLDLLIHVDTPVHVMASAPSAGVPLSRLSDAINAVFFQVPLWPFGIAAMWMRGRSRPEGRSHRFSLLPVAALAVGLQVATLLLTRGGQGESRDWDIRTGLGATLGLSTAYLLVQGTRSFAARRLWVGVGAAALAIAIALWSVRSVESFQLARIAGHLAGQPAWTADQRSRALDFLGMHALNQGRFEESAEAWEHAIAAAPNPRYFYQAGLARLHGRRLEEARGLAMEAARRMPDKADPWWLLAAIARAAGDSAGTEAFMDSVRVRGSRTPPPGL